MKHDEILNFWIKVNELFEQVCLKTDQVWQKRKRILDTRLLGRVINQFTLEKLF